MSDSVNNTAKTSEQQTEEKETVALEQKEEVTETSPQEVSAEEKEDEELPKKGKEARIDELTWKWREEERLRLEKEREVEYWRNQAIKKPGPDNVQQDETAKSINFGEPRPQINNFETVDAYEDAVYEWRKKKENHDAMIQTYNQKYETALNNYREKESLFRKDNPDYNELIQQSPIFTKVMADAITYSENGPAIAYHLAKNKELANKVARMAPQEQFLEIGKLSVKLSSVKPSKQTGASPPLTQIKGGSGEQEIDIEKMSTKDFIKMRNAQLYKKER